MKNACILLKKKPNVTLDRGANAVFEEIYLGGYAFDEIRVLPQTFEEQVIRSLESLKKDYENVFLFAEKTALPIARRCVEQVFSGGTVFADYANAAIFTDKKTSIFPKKFPKR